MSVVNEHLEGIGEEVSQVNDNGLLQKIQEAWDLHKTTMIMIRDILMYMDRTFVKTSKRVPVYHLGLRLFLENVARHKHARVRLRSLLLASVAQERGGELIDHVLVKNILDMLVRLGGDSRGVYQHDFERHFLQETEAFYRDESLKYLSENTCLDYIEKAEMRLQEERDRVAHYLHRTTDLKLIKIVETELVLKHAKELVLMSGSGCVAMFKDNKVADLQRMYRLFNRVPETLQFVQDALYKHIVDIGQRKIKDQEQSKDAVSFIEAVLNMRDKYQRIVMDSFVGDKRMERTMKEGFEQFMNVDSRCAQFLSQFCDNMLKKQLKGLSEREVDERLDKVIIIFRYLQDRDVFSDFYRRHLSKRLLSGRSASDDAEKSMIGKLKAECGYQFTQQLEGMFTDIRLSKKVADQFVKKCPPEDDCPVEIAVKVLTNGFWPNKTVKMCRLPDVLTRLSKKFEDFYLQQHQGRKIAWQGNMGSAAVRARFGAKKYDLSVSTFQMCVLLLYNDKESYTFGELVEYLGVDRAELKLHVVSLNLPKYRLLTKSTKSKSVQDTDVFTVNPKFKSKLMKVRVPVVTAKPKAAEKVPKQVQEDRRVLVEAAIVRIMKTRQVRTTVCSVLCVGAFCFALCNEFDLFFFSRPDSLFVFHTPCRPLNIMTSWLRLVGSFLRGFYRPRV
jgi:cullin 3